LIKRINQKQRKLNMIRIEKLHKSYITGSTKLHVIKGINLYVGSGELVSIMGSSGSGKSTLLNVVGILDNYDSGDYYLIINR
jgi:putative ABC transport system ATP-binding protein